jgi:hypothetical protein
MNRRERREQERRRNTLLLGLLGLLSLVSVVLAARAVQGAEQGVIASFTACNERRCTDHQLVAPDLMQCSLFGQQAISKWLLEHKGDGWPLKNGWVCSIGQAA